MVDRLIEMTPGEFIDISQVTAALRAALDVMPDNSPGRDTVLVANTLLLATLQAIRDRDGRQL